MTRNFEYMTDNDVDKIAILENRTAELERRLLAATQPGGVPVWGNVATPDDGAPGAVLPKPMPADAVYDGEPEAYPDADAPDGAPADDDGAAPGPDGRTEALIKHGRPRARRNRTHWILAQWRLVAVAAAALLAGLIAALVSVGGSGASWPGSVTTVQAEIKQACANANVAAEPTGLNFACAPSAQPVLWVFSLLTSGNNPGFVDPSTGRKGLEPIQPAQGGDIAWSLNLHHPYNPASPVDSLQVAARAINNIIGGATLTSSSGGADVEPGLESKAANCARYTGSSLLVTRAGYPAICAAPLTASGAAALVSDVFQQWMGGTPARIASEAGVLFENADNPGNPQVQSILNSLPASGG
jgi:hypothetical protein